jgi:hypothetical protein
VAHATAAFIGRGKPWRVGPREERGAGVRPAWGGAVGSARARPEVGDDNAAPHGSGTRGKKEAEASCAGGLVLGRLRPQGGLRG